MINSIAFDSSNVFLHVQTLRSSKSWVEIRNSGMIPMKRLSLEDNVVSLKFIQTPKSGKFLVSYRLGFDKPRIYSWLDSNLQIDHDAYFSNNDIIGIDFVTVETNSSVVAVARNLYDGERKLVLEYYDFPETWYF